MSQTLLSIEGLSKSYVRGQEQIYVLKDFHLELSQGEFLGIMGPSGSGKSTLLNLIACLDEPDEGKILLRGNSLLSLNERERSLFRRDHMGFIFQFFHLLPSLTVLENIALPLFLKGVGYKKALEQAREQLKWLGLSFAKDPLPNELSGGEMQRVAIARALISKPDLILADEPTGNLDYENSQNIAELLRNASHEFSQTVLLVTHDLEIAQFSDRSLTLQDGVIS